MQYENYYKEDYFEYQRPLGEFGGQIDKIKFEKYVSESDVVLDFGCGGGYILKNLQCRKKIGVEINPAARQVAQRNGIEVYAKTDDVIDLCDVIISNHVLEHTHNPLEELQKLRTKLRKGGIFVLCVPCESIRWKYIPKDKDQHLYTWSPMSIGNLVECAGFRVIESKPFTHSWFRGSKWVIHVFGLRVFSFLAYIRGLLAIQLNQVRCIAKNE